jgi:hypothetical protein
VALAYDRLHTSLPVADYGITEATGGSGPIADTHIGRISGPNRTFGLQQLKRPGIRANQISPPTALLNWLDDVNGTTLRLSTPNQRCKCLLPMLRQQ